MSALGSPYAAERIQRANGMKCVARSAAAHKIGYAHYYNPDSSSETYPQGSTLDRM